MGKKNLIKKNYQLIFYFLGLSFSIIGQILRTLAMFKGGINFTHSISHHTKENFLVTTGPYKYLRHPGYSGFFLWIIGIQVLLINPLNLILCIFVLKMFFANRINEEERILYEHYGIIWLEYCKNVPKKIFLTW